MKYSQQIMKHLNRLLPSCVLNKVLPFQLCIFTAKYIGRD
jgi:hypothetical protein